MPIPFLHSCHNAIMSKKGMPACSLRGAYFATTAVLVTIPLLIFAYITCVRAAQGNGFSPFPWWPSRIKYPIVFFPAYSTSRLTVRVTDQNFSDLCPKSATFEFYSGHTEPWKYSDDCALEASRLLYDESEAVLEKRFSPLPGVHFSLPTFGSITCAPLYLPLHLRLFAAGYVPGTSLAVACYDFRMAPNVDVTPGHTFLSASKSLIESLYEKNGQKRVFLLGHSNGAPMATFLLRTQPAEWLAKYVAGFVAYGGNWAGQGSFVQYLFTGFSFFDFVTPKPDACYAMQTWPALYFSLAQPKVYRKKEVIVKAGNTSYTPADIELLLRDANLTLARTLFPLYNGLVSPDKPPPVDTYLFYGSNRSTKVGILLAELQQGVKPEGSLLGTGDGDQEEIDNLSILGWGGQMAPLHFEATELPGVAHVALPFSLKALKRTLEILGLREEALTDSKLSPLSEHPRADDDFLRPTFLSHMMGRIWSGSEKGDKEKLRRKYSW
eukprot:TRINITY_DN14934_c0_g1_i1.p1 TRINITY_DN14934_c0_g1~~TRINITY_DN14934_c0_g1_i1.p1  ORF type:complete len:495 (-),score=96.15 TRINITY_DN14934_c0_g1_i1:778-2262(-)